MYGIKRWLTIGKQLLQAAGVLAVAATLLQTGLLAWETHETARLSLSRLPTNIRVDQLQYVAEQRLRASAVGDTIVRISVSRDGDHAVARVDVQQPVILHHWTLATVPWTHRVSHLLGGRSYRGDRFDVPKRRWGAGFGSI